MTIAPTVSMRTLLNIGLLAGFTIVYTGLIGMIQVFSERSIIYGILTLGQLLIFLPPLVAGFIAARRSQHLGAGRAFVNAGMVGLITAVLPILLVLFISNVDIRFMFVNASPALIDQLTFGRGVPMGSAFLALAGLVSGSIGGILVLLPLPIRRSIIFGASWVIGVGLLSELMIQILRNLFGNNAGRIIFQSGALKPLPAIIIFVVAALASLLWSMQGNNVKSRYAGMSESSKRATQRAGVGLLGVFLLMLPWIVGTFLSEVLSNVGLYVLMALGLNIAVGLAGLLDLGYVTNFAVGAYVMGVLTSTGPLGKGEFSFWLIIPVSVISAMITGFLLALPVLRMRGDYLAIATLGFGEIIRLLALSDWLAPYIGGAQGILFIPKPQIGGFIVDTPQEFYYLILAACFIMLFISVRLNNSRTGRQWMAMREDEDAAGAMGIDTTLAKLLAFTLSAASGGLAGAIFASKLGAIFPHSFSLLISINVLSIIIVGGMGSIPGIVVGALALIGLPELLREFSEYRLLLYGALLIIMMLVRPQGLWPSAVRQRELQEAMPDATAAAD
jgi:branched-chain amino acid transport system permease protein